MVAQNLSHQFLAKIYKFFEDDKACKRHRLHAVYTVLTHACMVAYATAYMVSTQRNISRPNSATGHTGCPEKVGCPEPSVRFCKTRYKNNSSPKSR